MNKTRRVEKTRFLFLLIFLLTTNWLSLKTLKKVYLQDIKVQGSQLFTGKDLINNSSLNVPTRLIFIKTKFIEKELKQNLSLEKISVARQILPFGLKVLVKTRTPIAYGEREINGIKTSGFIDKEGFFINQKYAEIETNERRLIQVFGWQENFKEILSEILSTQENYNIDIVKIKFSPNGFLTLEEKNLKTILLGFNQNLIKSQLNIISTINNELMNNKISDRIDKIDLTDPNNPKIKVFKP